MTEHEINELNELRLPELQSRFAEVVGEETRCPNRTYLVRRIAERIDSAIPTPAQPAENNDAGEEMELPTEEINIEGDAMIAEDNEENLTEAIQPNDIEPAPERTAARPRLSDLDLDGLRARYGDVVGRPTASQNRNYLIWKIRQIETGRIQPRAPRPENEAGEFKIIPLRMTTDAIESLDAAWRAHGFKSRMDFIRQAMKRMLEQLVSADARE